MTRHFSALSLLGAALSGQRSWNAQWRRAEPASEYDVVIVGGGAHGLGTAWHLAKDHGIPRIAVVEKGGIGARNTGRYTAIIRSNPLSGAGGALYEHASQLWENLSQALDCNGMFSRRGVLTLAHTPHDLRVLKRHVHASRAAGIDSEWLTAQDARELCPRLDIHASGNPVLGAALQRRGGTARHDAVVRGYARAAGRLGVDVIEGCEVTGVRRDARGAISALETTRGLIRCRKAGVAAAGHSSALMKMAGLEVPLQIHPLQALVSEPVKPILPCVLMSSSLPACISQSDRGELVISSDTGFHGSGAPRDGLQVPREALESICELLPMFRRLRMTRAWNGTIDVTPDRAPIIGPTPVPGLYLNCGWGAGGFKATPASAQVFAWTIANDEPHPLAASFGLERFRGGRRIEEAAAAAVTY